MFVCLIQIEAEEYISDCSLWSLGERLAEAAFWSALSADALFCAVDDPSPLVLLCCSTD